MQKLVLLVRGFKIQQFPKTHSSKLNPSVIRFENSINNVKLPHDACLISRVNCTKYSFPKSQIHEKVTKTFWAEFSLTYLNLHTHVSLALRHNLHASAYVLSFCRDLWSRCFVHAIHGFRRRHALKICVCRLKISHFQFPFYVKFFNKNLIKCAGRSWNLCWEKRIRSFQYFHVKFLLFIKAIAR